jgi:hypothetical protein
VLGIIAAVAWVLRAMRGGPAPALEHPPQPSKPWPPLALRPEEAAVAAGGTSPITATEAVAVDLQPASDAAKAAVWTVQVGDGEPTTIEVLADDDAEAEIQAEIEAEDEAVAEAKILLEGDAAAILEPEPRTDPETTIDPDAPPPVEAGWVAEAIAGVEPTPPAPPPQASPEPAWVEPVDGACPVTHPVKAKLSSGIFHPPGGLNYLRTNPDRCYVSVEAAEADGLRSSKR